MKVKKVLIIISILLVASYISYNFGINRTGSFKSVLESSEGHHSPPPVVIEPGSGVETASYIIFHDDETPKNYYAKDGSTGEIKFSGTDAATVIQPAIDALTDGGKIFIKTGIYDLTGYGSIIIDKDFITLEGEVADMNRLSTSQNGTVIIREDGDVIQLEDVPGMMPGKMYLGHVRILNIKFIGGSNGGHGITSHTLDDDHLTYHLEIGHCMFTGFTGTGKHALNIKNAERLWIHDNEFRQCESGGSQVKLYLTEYQGGNIVVERNEFYPNGDNQRCLEITTEGSEAWSHGLFQGNHYHGFSSHSTHGVLINALTARIIEMHFIREVFERTDMLMVGNENGDHYVEECGVHNSGFILSSQKTNQVLINLTYTRACKIDGNYLYGNTEIDAGVIGIYTRGYHASLPNLIKGNTFVGSFNKEVDFGGSSYHAICRDNPGFKTESWGTATMSNGASSVTFAHGLGGDLDLKPTHISFSDSTGEIISKGGHASMMNTTHVKISLYSGTLTAGDSTIYWYTEYNHE